MKNNTDPRFSFHLRLFIGLFFLFATFYAVESITHECGHYMAARVVGHKHPVLHYKSTDTGKNALQEEFRYFRKTYKEQIRRRERLPNHERYAEVCTQLENAWEQMKAQKFTREHALITLAGPLETVLTGLIGLLIMLYGRRRIEQATQLTPWQWLAIYASLFWLVPAVGLIARIVMLFVPGFSDTSSDIYRICVHFSLDEMALYIVMGTLGIIGVVKTFKLVPRHLRWTLAIAVLTGIPISIFLWNVVGPILLP